MSASDYAAGRFDDAAALLPGELCRIAASLPPAEKAGAEELRLRVGAPMAVSWAEGDRPLSSPPVTLRDIEALLEKATGASAYASEESVRQGYVTAPGGHRIGLCGRAAVKAGEIAGFTELSSASLRVAREHRGAAADTYAAMAAAGGAVSTVVVSPPGLGKTSFLRDLARLVSDGGALPPQRVAMADERGELAACMGGRPRLDVGANTDVLSGAPKDKTAVLLLRAMNPRVLVMDEITAPEDARALLDAANCGVRLLASAHGADVREFKSRRIYTPLLEAGAFKWAVTIRLINGERVYGREELC